MFAKSVLQRVALQSCLNAGSVCKLKNPTRFELNTHQIESFLEKAPTLQGRRAEGIASHVSYFSKVHERLSAETAHKLPHPSCLALASTLPPLVPQWEYLGRLFSSWTHFKLHSGSS